MTMISFPRVAWLPALLTAVSVGAENGGLDVYAGPVSIAKDTVKANSVLDNSANLVSPIKMDDLKEAMTSSSEVKRLLVEEAERTGDTMVLYGDTYPKILEYSDSANDFRTTNDKKIVQFYDSECSGCQRFVPKYVDLTKKMASMDGSVKVYAVCCKTYMDVCLEEYARSCINRPESCPSLAKSGFPAILAYPMNDNVGNYVQRLARIGDESGYQATDIIHALNPPSPSGRRLLEGAELQEGDSFHLYGEDSSPVLEYTDSTNDFRASNKPKIVQFYDSTCSGCQRFKPGYVGLANQVISKVTNAQMYAVCCGTYMDICLETYTAACMASPETCLSMARSGFPALLAFPANQKAGTYVPRHQSIGDPIGYHADDLVESLKNPPTQRSRKLLQGTIRVGDNFVLYGDEHPPVLEYTESGNDFRQSKKQKIVQFYDATCSGCHKFKPYFEKLANNIAKTNAEVYAINCEAYLDVCVDVYYSSCMASPDTCLPMVHSGFPAILAFPENSESGIYVERFANPLNPSGYQKIDIEAALGSQQDRERALDEAQNSLAEAETVESENDSKVGMEQKVVMEDKISEPSDSSTKVQDSIPGMAEFEKSKQEVIQSLRLPSQSNEQNQVQELYWDATNSFVSALKNNVYVKDEPLNFKKKYALGNWLELMRVSLPPEWAFLELVEELHSNLNFISTSKANLNKILNKHQLPRKGWSPSCSKGNEDESLSCGTWKLLHVMSIGIAEHEGGDILVEAGTVESGTNIYSPMDAANAVRDYIINFCVCLECKKHFLEKFEDCSFRRCIRLSGRRGSSDMSDWKQFALWLWEVHNDMRVYFLPADNHVEEVKVLWPTIAKCLVCFEEDGSWDEEAVFEYLEKTYWYGSNNQKRNRILSFQAGDLSSHRHSFLWGMFATAFVMVGVLQRLIKNHSPMNVLQMLPGTGVKKRSV